MLHLHWLKFSVIDQFDFFALNVDEMEQAVALGDM